MFGKSEQPPDTEFFVIYDQKANCYRQPIQAENAHDAIRSYETLVRKNPDDQLVTNAEDFQLFTIGNYRKATGTILAWQPKHLVNLHEIKAALIKREQPVGIDRT